MTKEDAIKFFEDCKHHCGNAEFHNMAIEAIKRQIPKKPFIRSEKTEVGIGEVIMIYAPRIVCPCCQEEVDITMNFCPNCGQNLEWGETE